jgi:glucose dehydrogenase
MVWKLLWTGVVAVLVAVCGGVGALAAQGSPLLKNLTPLTDEVLAHPEPKDWLMWRRTYNAWGHSPLTQIDATNVSRLRLAWAWTQEPGNQEAAPLVSHGVMFLAQSNNIVHALDARTGDLLWEYRHPLPPLQGTYVKRQLEAVRKLISNKSISYKSLKAWQETDYPVSPFLALPCMWHKVFSYKGFVSR